MHGCCKGGLQRPKLGQKRIWSASSSTRRFRTIFWFSTSSGSMWASRSFSSCCAFRRFFRSCTFFSLDRGMKTTYIQEKAQRIGQWWFAGDDMAIWLRCSGLTKIETGLKAFILEASYISAYLKRLDCNVTGKWNWPVELLPLSLVQLLNDVGDSPLKSRNDHWIDTQKYTT